ncbi:MAG: hypothetical protein ACOWWO_06820 [Peptococcaceae bacterium]
MNLKKLLLIYCLVSFLCGSIAFATASKQQITVEFLNLKYYFNGLLINSLSDNQGFIYKKVTYVPLDMIGEIFEKEITWAKKAESIHIKDKNYQQEIIKSTPYSEISGYAVFAARDCGDINHDSLPESIQVLTSAKYAEGKEEWLWDDGQRWLVKITNGLTEYILFDEYVQLGTVEIFNATENYVSFLVKTHRQFLNIYHCNYDRKKDTYLVNSRFIEV